MNEYEIPAPLPATPSVVADKRPIAQRVGAMGSGRVGAPVVALDVDALGRVAVGHAISPPSLETVLAAARVSRAFVTDPRGDALLIADLAALEARSAAGVTVVPAPQNSRLRRALAAFAAATALAAVATFATFAPGVTPSAQALAVPTVRSVDVVLSGPVASIAVPAVSTGTIGGLHAATLSAPMASGRVEQVALATSRSLVFTVRTVVVSRLLRVGAGQSWTLADAADGKSSRVVVNVLRQSRVTLHRPAALPGALFIAATASHYDVSGVYKGDQGSTVQVEAWRAGRWVPVATLGTWGAGGDVVGLVQMAPGRVLVRVERLRGQNVTGGVSKAFAVTVLPVAAANGSEPAPYDI